MYLRFKKFLIWTFIAALLGNGVLGIFTSPQKAKAASISFSVPGKWYQDGSTNNIYNKIEMTKNGQKETVKWTYDAEGSGVIMYKPYGGNNQPIENVTIFRLNEPIDLISQQNLASYYLFVVNGQAIELGYKLGALGDMAREEFVWADSIKAFQAGQFLSFTRAQGGADTPFGQYLSSIGPYIRTNKPTIGLLASSGPPSDGKNACQEKLIGPLNKNPGGNPLNQLFEAINKQLGETVISPLSDSEDLELYHHFFKTREDIDYSDTYIDSILTPTYKNFVNEFYLTESGLAWFWTDEQASKEKNGIYTLIGAAAILKVGGGPLTLAIAAVGTVATLGVDYYKANVNKAQWPKMARLITAKVYIDAHMQYDRCVAQNTTDQTFKDKVANEEKNYLAMMKLIDQQVADYIEAQIKADTGVLEGSCVVGKKWTDYASVAFWISKALCGIIELVGDIADWLTTHLFKSVFNAYNTFSDKTVRQSFLLNGLIINKVHAADEVSTLSDAFTNNSANKWPWVIESWKWVLVLTDLFLVVVLLFLGIVNILHIQYDTYAIKKMLPLLIVGVILANFSLLIMRMLIDASNILTQSFMGGTEPGDMVADLIKSITLTDKNPGFFEAWTNVGILLVGTIFAVFGMFAFLILGVMFYIRYAAVILLAIVAPLAFISMAFPPTQGLFKQWWSWTTKMIFMKPIAFFLLLIALKVKGSGATTSLTGWIIITALVYMAILVPWKLGGAVAAMWGGAMGSLFGTKKGGWSRTPVEKWWGQKKRNAGNLALKKLPGVRKFVGSAVNKEEASENERKRLLGEGKRESDERAKGRYTKVRMEGEAEENLGKTHAARWGKTINTQEGGKYTLIRKELEDAETNAKTQEAQFKEQMRQGTFNTLSEKTLKKYANVNTALELKAKYAKSDHLLDTAERALKKRIETDLSDSGGKAVQLHQDLMAEIKGKTVTNLDGKDLEYDEAQTARSSLLREYSIEEDEGKKQEIANKLRDLEGDIISFENQQVQLHPNINFNHYLDKNHYGRMQARLNPAIAEDAEAIIKSENIIQITDALENGGGSGESRFSAQHSKDYLAGNIEAVPITARAGIQAYLMAYQTKIGSSSGIDYLPAVAKGLEVFDKMSPGAKEQLFQTVKAQMTDKNIKGVQDEAGKSIDELTAEDIIKFDINARNSKTRDFVRRLAVAIKQHPALGAAGSPGGYVGRGKSSTLAENLMSGKPPQIAEGVQPGTQEYEQEYQKGVTKRVQDIAAKSLGGAIALTGTTPQRNILVGAAEAIDQIRESRADTIIDSLETDVLSRIKPTQIQINDPVVRKQAIDIIADFQGNDFGALNAQLQQIDPSLSVSSEQFSELQWQAKRVKTGRENIDGLAKLAVTETCLPHYSSHVKNMTPPVIDQLQTFCVTPLAERIQTRAEHGESLSADQTIRTNFDYLLKTMGHIRSEREEIINGLDTNPQAAIDLVRKKGLTLEAAKRLKGDYQRAVDEAQQDQRTPPRNFEDDATQVMNKMQDVINERFQSLTPINQPATPTPPPPPGASPQGPAGVAGPAARGTQTEPPTGPAGGEQNANDLS